MIVPIIVFELSALWLGYFWARRWFGANPTWVEGRGRGWWPLFFLGGFVFFQLIALGLVFFDFDNGRRPLVDVPVIRDAVSLGLITVLPFVWMGWLFWWPRFLLPGWVQERLKAGDPVRTARPLPQVQHLMTKPQNLEPDFTPSTEQLSLPTTIRVKTARWWFGGLFCCLGALMMLSVLFGIPADAYSEPSASLGVLRLLSIVGLPLTLWLAVYYLRGAVRPDHITLSNTGVRATSWGLAWDEIEEVEVKGDPTSHKGQVLVRPKLIAFSRERENNKWFSGRPFGLGGRVSDQPYLRFQPGTDIMPGTLAEIILRFRPENPAQATGASSTLKDTGARAPEPEQTVDEAAAEISLPRLIEVRTTRWWAGGIFCVLAALLMASFLFGIPGDAFNSLSARGAGLRAACVVGLPLTVWLAIFYLRGAIRPDHIRLDEFGIRATSWGVSWDEVEEVSVKGNRLITIEGVVGV